ncbi:MAG: hypothetical protein WBV95_18475 [Desulfobacterales bacterium]
MSIENRFRFFYRRRNFDRCYSRREVKILMAMDRNREPHRYDEWAENIVSGGDRRSLMNSILTE